jgi:hypothetical protein
MKDPHSTSGKDKEPPRPRTVPDDFFWDPKLQAWYPPGEPSDFDVEAFHQETMRIIEEVRNQLPIPAEQLRVPPGTLDVPPAWRKSLGEDCDLFSELIEDDEDPEKQQSPRAEPDD